MKYIILFFWIMIFPKMILAQGNIDHIINQEYMKLYSSVDCDSGQLSDLLSIKICSNFSYQQSDKELISVYDSILLISKYQNLTSLHSQIIETQRKWREFRDSHCELEIFYFEDCINCHQRGINYLLCLKDLTDKRVKELRDFKKELMMSETIN
ncbi:DUF1311 domain-containing protein [Cyclobacteriaceae bacterium YHN15]|nr:DUF1311 domain-containing protein [Cyclobacteriaceae bacterium YHN15]